MITNELTTNELTTNELTTNELKTNDEVASELITNDKVASWNPVILHHAIATSFKDYNLKHLNLPHYSEQIVEWLLHLPSTDTFKFLKIIDYEMPGVSFHFIVESVNFVYGSDKLLVHKLLFSFRASYYLACFPDKQMLAPMRTRLCNSLLFEHIPKTFFTDFQQKMHDVDKQQFMAKEDRVNIKKQLYLQHFNQYIEKITLDSEEDYEDEHYDE